MNFAENLARVRERMAAACARSGRAENSARLMAVTKTQPAERIREALELGLRLLGENRVQEAETKRPALAGYAAEWHLIGPLQANKAARALALFQAVQSLDRSELARRLDRLAGERHLRPAVLLEINLGREAQKSGILPEAAAGLAAAVLACPNLELRGLMAIPPAADRPEAQRPYFAALRELAGRLRHELALEAAPAWELSMGMSQDYEIAIEEGATLVRLGAALFGARPPQRL